jgi:hypothetical protein
MRSSGSTAKVQRRRGALMAIAIHCSDRSTAG